CSPHVLTWLRRGAPGDSEIEGSSGQIRSQCPAGQATLPAMVTSRLFEGARARSLIGRGPERPPRRRLPYRYEARRLAAGSAARWPPPILRQASSQDRATGGPRVRRAPADAPAPPTCARRSERDGRMD